MDSRDLDKIFRDIVKYTEHIEDRVYVYNGARQLIKSYDAFELAKSYFLMSNDDFYEIYGFNFVPRGQLRKRAKLAVEEKLKE